MPFNAQRHTGVPITPAWALECWLWEDDYNTAARVDELLNGYAQYNIQVRTIIIDSPWSTRYNDFIVDTTRYPKPAKWFCEALLSTGVPVGMVCPTHIRRLAAVEWANPGWSRPT